MYEFDIKYKALSKFSDLQNLVQNFPEKVMRFWKQFANLISGGGERKVHALPWHYHNNCARVRSAVQSNLAGLVAISTYCSKLQFWSTLQARNIGPNKAASRAVNCLELWSLKCLSEAGEKVEFECLLVSSSAPNILFIMSSLTSHVHFQQLDLNNIFNFSFLRMFCFEWHNISYYLSTKKKWWWTDLWVWIWEVGAITGRTPLSGVTVLAGCWH